MVDLETLSTRSNALILTIGAVPFNNTGDVSVGEELYFYQRVSLDSYQDCFSFHMDYKTLVWWMKQDKDPLNEAFLTEPRYSIHKVMANFRAWMEKICKLNNDNKINIWSHGKDFDVVVLENAFRNCRVGCPWNYWDTRDTRTIYSLTGINLSKFKMPEGFKAHNAIGDCLKQIAGLKKSFEILTNISSGGSEGSEISESNDKVGQRIEKEDNKDEQRIENKDNKDEQRIENKEVDEKDNTV